MSETSPAAPQGSRRSTALDESLDLISDRFNPILVKELRQSLRGKAFRVAFVCVLVVLTFASVGALLSASTLGQSQGREFFLGIYICLSLALCGLVPFAAFASLGGEWEENTFDLLVLSDLRPNHVVRGKLMSAAVQALLYLATFAPFLACAFLMQGVDLGAMLVILLTSFLWSVALSMVAIMLSTLARQRFLRIGMMALLAGLLAMGFGMAISGAEELLGQPDTLRSRDFLEAGVGFVLLVGFLGTLMFQNACNHLAHPEENRSTRLRVTTTGALLAGILWTSYMLFRYPSADAVAGLYSFLLFLGVVLPSTLFVSEPSRLGRRVAADLGGSRITGWLLAPWLPGGGRGVLFFLIHLGLLMIVYPVVRVLSVDVSAYPLGGSGMFAFYGLCLYATGYVLLPSGVLSRGFGRLPVRVAARVLVPVLALLLFMLPALMAFLFGVNDLDSFEHPGNPGYMVLENWEELEWTGGWVAVALFAGVALLINLPRLIAGVDEVRDVQDRARLKSADPVEG